MQLDHPVIPDGKETIRDYWSHVRDSRANLRTLPQAKVDTLQASIMTALNNTPNMFKSIVMIIFFHDNVFKELIGCSQSIIGK